MKNSFLSIVTDGKWLGNDTALSANASNFIREKLLVFNNTQRNAQILMSHHLFSLQQKQCSIDT